MLTKNELKYYASLLNKKERDAERKFLVEGKKIIGEALLSPYKCEAVIASNQFIETESEIIRKIEKQGINIRTAKNNEIEKLSDTVTPQGIIGIFKLPNITNDNINDVGAKLVVLLENVSDPGNMGTILRNCDWFGIQDVIVTHNCADAFSPKVIRSSMGSIFHIKINKISETEEALQKLKQNNYQLLLADLTGEDISQFKPANKSVLILCNEANGPSDEINSLADKKITVKGKGKAESLNVANASAVMLYALTK